MPDVYKRQIQHILEISAHSADGQPHSLSQNGYRDGIPLADQRHVLAVPFCLLALGDAQIHEKEPHTAEGQRSKNVAQAGQETAPGEGAEELVGGTQRKDTRHDGATDGKSPSGVPVRLSDILLFLLGILRSVLETASVPRRMYRRTVRARCICAIDPPH